MDIAIPRPRKASPPVVRLILDRQASEGWSDAEMASHLGVPRTTWSAVKNGRSGLSLGMAQKIAQRFPELAAHLLDPDQAKLPGNLPA